MRNKTQFWTLLFAVAMLVLTSNFAFASYDDLVPLVDGDTGKPYIETGTDGIICDECKANPTLNIVYADCGTQTVDQTTTATGARYVFDRDAALLFNSATHQATGWDDAWWDSSTDAISTTQHYSHIGYCENTVNNYLFSVCYCDQHYNMDSSEPYAFEVEILADGVYWTDRNLSLWGDFSAGNYPNTDLGGAGVSSAEVEILGGHPYNNDLNVIRAVVGPDKGFFCDGNCSGAEWWEIINAGTSWGGAGSWALAADGDGYGEKVFDPLIAYPNCDTAATDGEGNLILSYLGVRDYPVRDYGTYSRTSSLSSATVTGDFVHEARCRAETEPFELPLYNATSSAVGQIGCSAAHGTAKVLRTYPQYIFGDDSLGTIQSAAPTIYLDLPTMMYDPDEVELGDVVEVLISLVIPYDGMCSICCNKPICSCVHTVGVIDCSEETSTTKRCVPYYPGLDDFFTGLAITNTGSSAITATCTFYAGGHSASFETGNIAAKSVWAAGISPDSDDLTYYNALASASGFDTAERGYIEVEVPSSSAFDVYYFFFKDSMGMTSYLARCSACSAPCAYGCK